MMRLFLTGSPGVGKTTLIRVVIARLEEVTCAGFYTEEKRQRGQRVGFRIVTLSGREGPLPRWEEKSPRSADTRSTSKNLKGWPYPISIPAQPQRNSM